MLNLETDWAGFLAFCEQPGNWRQHAQSDSRNDIQFRQSESYAEAMSLARHGWVEGRDRIAAGLRTSAPAFARHSTRRMEVAGVYPMAPLAAAGEPLNMVDIGEDNTPRPVIRLAVAVNFASGVHFGNVINRGIAICRVIDALEQSGTRVELVAGWHAKEHGGFQRFSAYVTVKAPEEPLEIDRVAFAFAHPSMNRRLGFRLREITMPNTDGWSAYGQPIPLNREDFRDAIIVQTITPHTQDDFDKPEDAFRAVAKIMQAEGVEIETEAHA